MYFSAKSWFFFNINQDSCTVTKWKSGRPFVRAVLYGIFVIHLCKHSSKSKNLWQATGSGPRAPNWRAWFFSYSGARSHVLGLDQSTERLDLSVKILGTCRSPYVYSGSKVILFSFIGKEHKLEGFIKGQNKRDVQKDLLSNIRGLYGDTNRGTGWVVNWELTYYRMKN